MFIGEAPGYYEDVRGKPFVGNSGKLLNNIIESMGLKRKETYICNAVMCRPRNNRTPNLHEIKKCRKFLDYQIDVVSPKIIITLGRTAIVSLMNKNVYLKDTRNMHITYKSIRVFSTFHPSYLMRYPLKKKDAWKDIEKATVFLKPFS